jgi:pSer/pThr/pTyr-binding forkhead associated (FHA) protein
VKDALVLFRGLEAGGVPPGGFGGRAVTLGKTASNDITIDTDPTVSRLHAVLEYFPAGWCIRDLASRNGTFVNGQRVLGERRLQNGDEIV